MKNTYVIKYKSSLDGMFYVYGYYKATEQQIINLCDELQEQREQEIVYYQLNIINL